VAKMGLMDWEFIFKRRKWSLERYLSNCLTIEDAQNKFKAAGMVPPSEEILMKYIILTTEDFKNNKMTTSSGTSDKKSSFREVMKTKKSVQATDEKESKYDDIVVIDTSE
jgi:hypothetical protein